VAAIVVAINLNIPLQKIKSSIKSYLGLKRRIEKVGVTSRGHIIYDDFAHSPVKASGSLDAVRKRHKDSYIVGVYYPRISLNSNRDSLDWYDDAFASADKIIIPRVPIDTKVPKENRVYGKDILEAISRTHSNVEYMPKNEQILEYFKNIKKSDVIILIMSSSSQEEFVNNLMK